MPEPWKPFDEAFDWAMKTVRRIPVSQYPFALAKWMERDPQDDRAWAMRQVLTDLMKQTPAVAT